MLIQELHRLKNYRVETLYLASSIVDRYLAKQAAENVACPNLVHLAVVGILLAAKLE